LWHSSSSIWVFNRYIAYVTKKLSVMYIAVFVRRFTIGTAPQTRGELSRHKLTGTSRTDIRSYRSVHDTALACSVLQWTHSRIVRGQRASADTQQITAVTHREVTPCRRAGEQSVALLKACFGDHALNTVRRIETTGSASLQSLER
jgi:hypothetical protein